MHRKDKQYICLVGFSCCCSLATSVLTDNPVFLGVVYTLWGVGLGWLTREMWNQYRPPGVPLRMWWRMRRLGYSYLWLFKRFTHKDGDQEVRYQDGYWSHTSWKEFRDTSVGNTSALAASPIAAHVLGQLNASDCLVADDYH